MYLSDNNKTATHLEEEEQCVADRGTLINYVIFLLCIGKKVPSKLFCDLHHIPGNISIMISPYEGKSCIFAF